MGDDADVVRGTDVHTTKLEGGAWYQLLNGVDHGFGDVSIIVTEDAPTQPAVPTRRIGIRISQHLSSLMVVAASRLVKRRSMPQPVTLSWSRLMHGTAT